jgi:hypothetical protein
MNELDIAKLLREMITTGKIVIGEKDNYAKGYLDALEAVLAIVDSEYIPACLRGEDEK